MITYQCHCCDSFISDSIAWFSRRMNLRGNFPYRIPSHISIKTNEFVYESHIKTWVHKVPIGQYNYSGIAYTIILEDVDEKRVIDFLEREIWKKYDKFWIFSFIWRFVKQKKWKWFCSEYALVSLAKWYWISFYNQRISPIEFILQILFAKWAKFNIVDEELAYE